jgi:hypothetical protein
LANVWFLDYYCNSCSYILTQENEILMNDERELKQWSIFKTFLLLKSQVLEPSET